MKRAFTLVELLVVVGIMGLLGTISVGGYRAMQRGMEERGVMQNVNQFIRSAYQRAQIDRLPVSVYFWNETLQEETDTDPLIVVGKAVAVRRSGRITATSGSYLYDEFGDLSFQKLTLDEDEDEDSNQSGEANEGNTMYLYNLDDTSGSGSQFRRSVVSSTTKKLRTSEPLLFGDRSVDIECYAYTVVEKGECDWKVGSAYGFEFAELQLPHNFIFGSEKSDSMSAPVKEIKKITFRVSGNAGAGSTDGGSGSVKVSSLRPDSSGALAVQEVATSDSPTKDL
jgi:prepilin-type N-terminal cleavage/methylation domain-containing protein